MPDVKVTVTDVDRGASFETRTNELGEYLASPLRIGRYRVTVEKQGFKKAIAGPTALDVQERLVLDVTLSLGEVSEEVVVTADAPLLETETSELGQLIDSRRATSLPLNGRNYAQLAQLSAGVVPSEPGARDEGGYGFSAGGARSLQNNFLLDGIDNNSNLPDLLNETNFVIQPPLDAIAEFKVQTNAYSAEFGRGNGAILNAVIKSGTNDWHGNAYEFLRNEVLDARGVFDRNRQPYKQNQFGATFGGPVIIPGFYHGRNRTFFFVDYEGLRTRRAETFTFLVPTPAMIGGDFSSLLTTTPAFAVDPATGLPTTQVALDCNGNPTFAGEIFNTRLTQTGSALNPNGFCGVPINGAGVPTNIFAAGSIDPLAARLATLFPPPSPSASGSGFNYVANPLRRTDRNNFDVRLDHKFSDRDNAFLRYSYENQPSLIAPPFGLLDGGGFFSGDESNRYRSVATSETHVFTPRVINEFRFGFNHINSRRFQINFAKDVSSQLGFPGVPFGPDNGGLPQLTFTDSTPTMGSPTFLPSKELQNTYVLSDNFTFVHGPHSFKVGTEIRFEEFTIFQPSASRGTLSFGSEFTDNPAAPGTGGTAFATFLLGVPDGGSIVNLHNVDYTRPTYEFYGQDDVKVTPRLTLNLGLRYELFTTVKEAHDQQGTFDFAQQALIVPKGQTAQLTPTLAGIIPVLAIGSRGLVKPDVKNFAPRVGLAYKISSRLVMRTGYGIFYGGQENGPYSNPSPGFNPPFFVTQAFGTNCGSSSANPAPGQTDCSIPGLSFLSIDGFPPGSLVDPNTPLLFSLDPKLRTPYMQQWHLSLQYQLPFETLLEITYGGSKGTRLFTFVNANQETPTTSAIPGNLRRRVQTVNFAIDQFGSVGNSTYHSLQLKAEKRLSHGLSFLASYTYSHSIDDASSANLGAQNQGDFRDHRFPGMEKGNSDFDVRHRFVISYIYDLPFGSGKTFGKNLSGIANQVIGGWQVSGITSASTGNWFTISDTANFSNADAGGNVAPFSSRPDVVGDPTRPGPVAANLGCIAPARIRTQAAWFNPCAFVNAAIGTFGDVGRNTVAGPGFQVWDLSIVKFLPIDEARRFEFRSEFFNVWNHANWLFAQPGPQNTNLGTVHNNAQFATLTGARPPRLIQFALKFYF
jgi:hypothetical protein